MCEKCEQLEAVIEDLKERLEFFELMNKALIDERQYVLERSELN